MWSDIVNYFKEEEHKVNSRTIIKDNDKNNISLAIFIVMILVCDIAIIYYAYKLIEFLILIFEIGG